MTCTNCSNEYVNCNCSVQNVTVQVPAPISVTVTPGIGGGRGPQGVQGTQGRFGTQGTVGTQGIQGTQGRIGTQGPQGTQGTQGTVGIQGVQGIQGIQGQQGTQGVQGVQGTQGLQGTTGVQGATGTFGGETFQYNYLTNTSETDPGSGNIKFDSVTFSSVTEMYIDDIDFTSTDISSYLETIDDSSSGVKGTIKVTDVTDELNYAFFHIVGSHTDQGTWYTVPVAYVSGSLTLSNGDNVYTTFARVGDKGDTGAQGIQGIQGLTGIQGPQGNPATEVALNVLYVSKSGNDSNSGVSLADAKLTVKAALQIATAGTTVYVKSGVYYENNPVTIPAGVSLVGDNLRTTTIRPNNPTQDVFYVNNGNYITGFTFRGHLSPSAAIAYNPDGSAGNIVASPYINNCSSNTTTGTGMRVDGSVVGGGKSMLAAQYTQFNQGGKGIHIINQGYAQLISIYTICCDIGILCESGGFCSLIGSDTSFGNFGLKATGVSSLLYSGTSTTINKNDTVVTITGLSQTPFVNNVVTFDNGTTYYTIKGVTPISGGSSTVTLVERINNPISSGTTAKFYNPSRITAAGHTFEYSGSGTNVVTALPQNGGIPDQTTEVVQELGGQVYYTSTDQLGDFRIGGDLTINRGTGTITGITFDRSLFAVMTPYILAIEG